MNKVPPDRHGLLHQVAGGIRHSYLRGINSGGCSSGQLLLLCGLKETAQWLSPEFESWLPQYMFWNLGIGKTNITPLHWHSKHGGMTHKDSGQEFEEGRLDRPERFGQEVPLFLLAYTASTRDTTGTTTPAHCQELRLSFDLLFGDPLKRSSPRQTMYRSS
jgi:hypothetical protein